MSNKRIAGVIDNEKHFIRERVAQRMLEAGIVRPDPVFHFALDRFIAGFASNEKAVKNVIDLPEWQAAKIIFITPDNSTEHLREIAIRQGKIIEVTTYGICRGAVLLRRDLVPSEQEAFAASLAGMERFGQPLTRVADIQAVGPVDLMVTGALAISSAHGGRTGKGAGWFDAEWAMWIAMGLTTKDTSVIGIVHELQVVPESFPLQPWDSIINIIVTPTQVIRTPPHPQPNSILWEKMDADWLEAIPLMLELYERDHGHPFVKQSPAP